MSFRTRDVDVIVVGLGVLGASALCELARHGVDVVGIEQYQPGHASGSSHGRSRALRFLYDRPGYLELLALALDAWTDLEAATGRRLYWPCGSLFFGRPRNPQLAASLRFSETHGVEVQRLAPNEPARRWPSFALPAGHEGVSP